MRLWTNKTKFPHVQGWHYIEGTSNNLWDNEETQARVPGLAGGCWGRAGLQRKGGTGQSCLGGFHGKKILQGFQKIHNVIRVQVQKTLLWTGSGGRRRVNFHNSRRFICAWLTDASPGPWSFLNLPCVCTLSPCCEQQQIQMQQHKCFLMRSQCLESLWKWLSWISGWFSGTLLPCGEPFQAQGSIQRWLILLQRRNSTFKCSGESERWNQLVI